MKLNLMFKDAPDIDIDSIMLDSRQKLSNAIFFCIKGNIHDAHQYVEQAINNGAIAIVYSDDLSVYHENIIYIKVVDVFKSLIESTEIFYHSPSSSMTIFGVTGTNGKTSISNIIKDILNKYEKTGYIGTLGVFYDNIRIDGSLTTPDINQMNNALAIMRDDGVKACAIEVSSIGIDQRRIANINFDYAIFTNLTHDHLDYHGTMENYYLSKKQFFDDLKSNQTAITNVDDAYGLDIVANTPAKIITYGIDNEADYQAKDIELFADKTLFTLRIHGSEYRVETNLVARFNVYNLLSTIAALHQHGLSIDMILTNVKQISQIEGRMERIDHHQPFNILVDFAHTPDGIEKVMQYATSITPKTSRIIAVFGSAGKRDIKKRPIFGELADKYCDMIILTEDDPRDESVYDICQQIAKGIEDTNYIIIEDRFDAIRQAIELANSKDTIIILGKGDEKFLYEEFGKEPYIGDDQAVIEILDNYYKGE